MGFPTLLALAGASLAVAIGFLIYLRGRHPFLKVPLWRILLFFLYGSVVAPVAVVALSLLAGLETETALGAFLVIGPLEEVLKFTGPLFLVGLVSSWREEPFEWMLAGAAAGTGFAMTENALYALVFEQEAWSVFLTRSLAPMHLLWSATVGYRMGRRAPGAWGSVRALLGGLLLASFLHGLWDALCFTGYVGLLIVLFGGQIVGFTWQVRKMTWLCANRSPRRPDPAADAREAKAVDSKDVFCASCGMPYRTFTLRGAELTSCPQCFRTVMGRGDLYRLLNEYAGSVGWSPVEPWYRFYWKEREDAATLQCPTCLKPALPRRFIHEEGARVFFCDDCAMAIADKSEIFALVEHYRNRLESGFLYG